MGKATEEYEIKKLCKDFQEYLEKLYVDMNTAYYGIQYLLD